MGTLTLSRETFFSKDTRSHYNSKFPRSDNKDFGQMLFLKPTKAKFPEGETW